jgi:predicted glycoside hydrolase/deacetylase ChbG (UPF0249 family)
LRALVVNADDFGFTRDVNEGIVAAHREGILTATTLMANGAAFDQAVELARATPALDVGCHLVLVGGEGQPATVSALVRALALKQVNVYDELRRQVERIVGAGIIPTHLDTHKHTHLLPPVLDAVARLSEECRIPWVRRPFDLPLNGHRVPWGKRALSRGLGFLRRRFHRVLTRHGCRVTDHFAGFQITGRFEALDVIRLIESLPDGVTEFMVHPGYCTDELRAARTRLKESREHELQALIAGETREALARCAVRLATYRELG